MSTESCAKVDDNLLQRVCGEFLEMPGLRLTFEQAQRLWGLDPQTCRELLDCLIETNVLCLRQGSYSRATGGFSDRPPLRKLNETV